MDDTSESDDMQPKKTPKRRKGEKGEPLQDAQEVKMEQEEAPTDEFFESRIVDMSEMYGVTRFAKLSELARVVDKQPVAAAAAAAAAAAPDTSMVNASSSSSSASSSAPSAAKSEVKTDETGKNAVADLLSKRFEMTEEMLHLDAVKNAKVPHWYEAREDNGSQIKALLTEKSEEKRKAIFESLMAKCHNMPVLGISDLSRQLVQSGKFSVCIDKERRMFGMRDFPPCIRGANCQCMKATIPRAANSPLEFRGVVGTAMMTASEERRFWGGEYIRPKRTCHLCQWVDRAKLVFVVRTNVSKLPVGEAGRLMQLAMRQPYTVKVECPDGFDEQCVMKPDEPALVGQNMAIPSKPGDYSDLYGNLSERAGSPRLPAPTRCRDPFPVAPFPRLFTDQMAWVYDGGAKQWRIDLSRAAWRPVVTSAGFEAGPQPDRRRDDDSMEDDEKKPGGGGGPNSPTGGSSSQPNAAAAASSSSSMGGAEPRTRKDAWQKVHASAAVDSYTRSSAVTAGGEEAWEEKAKTSHTAERVVKNIQTCWTRQCIISNPERFLHSACEQVHYTLDVRCSYLPLLTWTMPMPTEFGDLRTAENDIAQSAVPLAVHFQECILQHIPHDVLHSLFRRPVRRLLVHRLTHNDAAWTEASSHKAFLSFVRWCGLVCWFRDLWAAKEPTRYEILEAVLYVIDGQWLDVFEFINTMVFRLPSSYANYDAWKFSRGGRHPFYSNPVLHFTELPYPTFMVAAMTRHGAADSELEYLWNKTQPRQAMFRTLETKAPEAMARRPFVCRYMKHVQSAAMLFGFSCEVSYEEQPPNAPKQATKTTTNGKRARTASRRAPAAAPPFVHNADWTVRSVSRFMPPKHASVGARCLQHDISLRGMIYRWWFTSAYEPCTQKEYKPTVMEWTMQTNQFALLFAMQALVVFCWHVDVAFGECIHSLLEVNRFKRDLVADLHFTQAWLAMLWPILDAAEQKHAITKANMNALYARCCNRHMRAYFDQHLWEACVHKFSDRAVAAATAVSASCRNYMSTIIRTRARVRFPLNSVMEILNDRFAADQSTLLDERLVSKMDVHEKLGLAPERVQLILDATQRCSALPEHETLIAKVLVDVLHWPAQDVALLYAVARKWHTVHPIENGMQAIAKLNPAMYMEARATAVLIRRQQTFGSILLPAHVAMAQLRAMQRRFERLNGPNATSLSDTVLLEGCVAWYCPVCQGLGTFVRPLFREAMEREMHPKFDGLSLLDCVVMCRQSERLCSNYCSVLPDRGADAMSTHIGTGKFYCIGCEVFQGNKCTQTPMEPIFLLGRLVSCGRGRWTTICPQPDCGVPCAVSMSTVWNEHGFACSKCTLRMAKDSSAFQNGLPMTCQLCDRKVAATRVTEWHPYGYVVCASHHADFDSILEFVDSIEPQLVDLEALKEAYAMWRRSKSEHNEIQKIANVLSKTKKTSRS
jgi:hypothetical protein